MTKTTKTIHTAFRSRSYSQIPGDDRQEITSREVACSDGTVLRRGTVFQPMSGGYDNASRSKYSTINVLVAK